MSKTLLDCTTERTIGEWDVTTDDGNQGMGVSFDLMKIDVPDRKAGGKTRSIWMELRSSDYLNGEDNDVEPVHPELEAIAVQGKKLRVRLTIEEIE